MLLVFEQFYTIVSPKAQLAHPIHHLCDLKLSSMSICSSVEAKMHVLVMTLTVPFEMNINKAHTRKMERYGSLVTDLKHIAGYIV